MKILEEDELTLKKFVVIIVILALGFGVIFGMILNLMKLEEIIMRKDISFMVDINSFDTDRGLIFGHIRRVVE
jgi:hypothetical protein